MSSACRSGSSGPSSRVEGPGQRGQCVGSLGAVGHEEEERPGCHRSDPAGLPEPLELATEESEQRVHDVVDDVVEPGRSVEPLLVHEPSELGPDQCGTEEGPDGRPQVGHVVSGVDLGRGPPVDARRGRPRNEVNPRSTAAK